MLSNLETFQGCYFHLKGVSAVFSYISLWGVLMSVLPPFIYLQSFLNNNVEFRQKNRHKIRSPKDQLYNKTYM